MKRRKVTFIMPAIGKKPGVKYIATWKMEPLPIAQLAALTPPEWEREFFDDRIELVDYETETDLVAISVETYTARRAYAIAARFRQRGIPVVMGGYHPTHLPEEAAQHADCVVTGNAETLWPRVLSDLAAGRAQRIYRGAPGFNSTLPDRSIFTDKKYLDVGLVETGRGCNYACGFCNIASYYQSTYYPRPVEQVIADVRRSGKRFFFFVDDNIGADPGYTLELCRGLAGLNIIWAGQGTVNMGRDPELLRWLRLSGCRLLLIGFESLDRENLKQMKKGWSAPRKELDRLVRAIHQAGISIYATFLFGFDHDAPETWAEALAFTHRHAFFYAAFNHLLPLPGTPHFEQLVADGRMPDPEWWLDPDYVYGDIAFEPAGMGARELSQHCVEARRRFFSRGSIAARGIRLLGRKPPLSFLSLYLMSNRLLAAEVEGKLSLPLGKGLDELPK